MVKKELRILGVDDGPFLKFGPKKDVLVVCTIYRGKDSIDGLLSFKVRKDGFNATKKLVQSINSSKHKAQISVIMIDGVALGGFNIIDLEELNKKTKLPVIAVIRRRPDLNSIKNALNNLSRPKKRWSLIDKLPPVSEMILPDGKVYFQHIGCEKELAIKIIKLSTLRGRIPEPIRVAHLIASGLVTGESRGRA
jgi:endonuclease V-like protein UPF0215 family